MIRNILIGALIGFVIVFFIGFKIGVHYEISKITKAALKSYETRGQIDNDVEKLNTYDLCISLGGMRVECDAMRGMDETTKN